MLSSCSRVSPAGDMCEGVVGKGESLVTVSHVTGLFMPALINKMMGPNTNQFAHLKKCFGKLDTNHCLRLLDNETISESDAY